MAQLTIIVPSFNHNRFLKQRLDSILSQTYQDWELIIIDDHSTDGSLETLKKFVAENKEKVKHFIINNENSGSGYNSWKKGIELAETEFIWIAETDDFSDENFLEKSIEQLEKHRDVALSFSASNYVDNEGEFLYDTTSRTKDLNVVKEEVKVFDGTIYLDKMPFQPYITNGSAVVFRKPKSAIPDLIFSHKQSSDGFLWSYLLKENKFVFINQNLNYFRRHESSTTYKNTQEKKQLLYFEKASFINYFNQQEKASFFIDNYIHNYIKSNKNKLFNISPILTIKGVKFLRIKYIFTLVKHFFKWISRS